jgi:hypothetical protein
VLTKVDWLAACIALRILALYWLFCSGVGVHLHNPPVNGKLGPIPEEIYQTLLTIKKQGKLN